MNRHIVMALFLLNLVSPTATARESVSSIMKALAERQATWGAQESFFCRTSLGMAQVQIDQMSIAKLEYEPRFNFIAKHLSQGFSQVYADRLRMMRGLYADEMKDLMGEKNYSVLESHRTKFFKESKIVATMLKENPNFYF